METTDFARLTVRFEKPEYETIERLAKERDVSNAEVVRQAVAAYLKADAENRRLRDLLEVEIGGINKKLEEHTAMLYGAIASSGMVAASMATRVSGESDADLKTRKHQIIDKVVGDAMYYGKCLVTDYPKYIKGKDVGNPAP